MKRVRQRAGITDKRISPHIFRHTFAVRYLILGNDPFSLQELLGHEDLATVLNYMHMNDETRQAQKRKYSPGDHLPTRMPGPREDRRREASARNLPASRRAGDRMLAFHTSLFTAGALRSGGWPIRSRVTVRPERDGVGVLPAAGIGGNL